VNDAVIFSACVAVYAVGVGALLAIAKHEGDPDGTIVLVALLWPVFVVLGVVVGPVMLVGWLAMKATGKLLGHKADA
jgi:hypothetical protein